MDLRNLKIEDVAAAAGITPLTHPPAYDQIGSRAGYERGGWFDGRLGQAFDLLDAVRREHANATAELRIGLQKACDLTEENDEFMAQLAKSGDL